MIFREQLCPQPIRLNGLVQNALKRPDQVESRASIAHEVNIWGRTQPKASRNDRIDIITLQRLPLVRKDRRLFCTRRTLHKENPKFSKR